MATTKTQGGVKASTAPKETTPEDKKVKSASVLSSTGQFVREYTEEHTDKDTKFVDKAKGYASKIGGTVRLA